MASHDDPPSSSQRDVWQMVLACLLVLLLAQALVSALGWSALNRLVASNTADRIELSVRKEAATIQTGLNMGKPLAQYFGVEQILQSLQDTVPGLVSAGVVLPDNQVMARLGTALDADLLVDVLNGRVSVSGPTVETMPSGSVRQLASHQVQLGLPLVEPGSEARGALVVSVEMADTARSARLLQNGVVMLGITLAAAVLLVVLLRYGLLAISPASRERARQWIPVLVLLLAQVAVTAHTTQTFRKLWLDVANDNAQLLAASVQADLQKVLSYGIAPDRLIGGDDYLHGVVASFPVIQNMRVRVGNNVVARSNDAVNFEDDFVLPLQHDGQPVAHLGVQLDRQALRAGVWARIIDAATVTLITIIAAMELLGLLDLAMRERWLQRLARWRDRHKTKKPLPPGLARPAMFGLLFAWALPLGFLPLYARSLVTSSASSSALQLLMALPIVVEMAAGLVAALLAGRLSDRHGWPRPVLMGFVLSASGSLACAWVDTLTGLALARGLVGLGYGLAWMGLQGLVVLNSPVQTRGQQMASLVAGLFAGHLSGVAVGAMLMQQVGAAAVFLLGGVLFIVPALGLYVLVRLSGGTNMSVPRRPAVVTPPVRRLLRLVFSRDFGMLVFAIIMPFSIAQVGLLTFALPLYMEANGAQASSTGRVLMIYGLFIIYLGPLMGRLADRSHRKKYWIVTSALAGSAGLLSLAWLDGLAGAIVAVVLLALAGCVGGGAQTAYMLAMNRVQNYGSVGATSVMRALDKVGQMLGPLLVASLFAWVGMVAGLVLTGVLYLMASLLFLLFAPSVEDQDRATVSRRLL